MPVVFTVQHTKHICSALFTVTTRVYYRVSNQMLLATDDMK